MATLLLSLAPLRGRGKTPWLRSLTVSEIRNILARCRGGGVAPACATPESAVQLCIRRLEEGLQAYVDSLGTVVPAILPTPDTVDVVSATVYHAFLGATEHDGLRWALCRILLGLTSQWWWLSTPVLTPWQRDDIVHQVHRRYEERFRLPVVIVQNPWSREAALMVLMACCRDTLVAMAAGRTTTTTPL